MKCSVIQKTKLNKKGEIQNCIVDGPISLDMFISKETFEHKGTLNRQITGNAADLLLFTYIHSNNISGKYIKIFQEYIFIISHQLYVFLINYFLNTPMIK